MLGVNIGYSCCKGNLIPVLVVKTLNSYTIFSEDEDGRKISLVWAMDSIELIKKVKAKDGLVYIDILVTDDFGCKNIRVPMSTFHETSIKSLQKYGIKISPMYYFAMSIYFQRIADKMPMEDASQVIGILRDTGSPLGFKFNGYTSKDAFVVKNNFASYKDYITEFNELLTPSKPLQYLLSATMAAPILTLLQQKYNYDVHSYCINIIGASSTGKTICSRVCASAWTNPTDNNIFSAMLATNNAGLKRLSGRYGIPIFLDEATVMANTKSGEYAYSVYEGCEKGRLNSDCTERASGTWSTIVCMSSETHFHSNRRNQNGGLAVRVHSIEDLEWTVSKEHAEKLNQFISRNYGVLGKRFTKYLFNEKIIDAEYKVEQTISADNGVLAEINTAENAYELFIDIKTNGYAEKEVTVSKSCYSYAIENDAMIGASADISISDTCNPEEIVLKYNIKEAYIDNTLNLYSRLEEFQGIKRLNIFKFHEDKNMLLPVETEFDVENGLLYAEVDELGTYCIMDMEIWLNNLGVEMPEENQPEGNAMYFNSPSILSASENSGSVWTPTYINAPIDLVFMIDSDGNYKNEFENEKSLIANIWQILVRQQYFLIFVVKYSLV